jgi:hypothetical protein
MSQIQPGLTPGGGTSRLTATEFFVGGGSLLGGGAVLLGLLSASPFAALTEVAYLVLALFIISRLARNKGSVNAWMSRLVWATLVLSLLVCPLSIWAHIVSFNVVTGAITALYIGSVVICLRSQLSIVFKFFATALAVAMVAAFVMLPAPAASANPDDKSSEWNIHLTVLDEAGKPIQDAQALCVTAMVWDRDKPFDAGAGVAAATDADGKAEFTFHEDTRLKVAICQATKQGQDSFEQTLDYPPQTAVLVSPFRGQDYAVQITLPSKPHSEGS